MIISNEYLKGLLENRDEIVKYAQTKYSYFKEQMDDAKKIQYSSKCDIPGIICPSLLKFRRDKKLKKGRLCKKIPDDNRYSAYIYSDNGNILALKNYNQFGCDMTVWFFEKDGRHYAVPFRGETNHDYGTKIINYSYLNGFISEYHEIERSHVISEIYDYNRIDDGYIECNYCSYLDASFSSITPCFFNDINSKLKERGISKELSFSKDIIQRSDYYYKIYLSDKNTEIEEYRVDNSNKIFIRKL